MIIKPITQKEAQIFWRLGVPLYSRRVHRLSGRAGWTKVDYGHGSPRSQATNALYDTMQFGVGVE